MPLLDTTGGVIVRGFQPDSYPARAHPPQVLAQLTVISLIVLSILPAGIMWDPEGFYLKWEVALLPIVLLLYGCLLLAGMVRVIRFNGMLVVGVLYSIAITFSIWYGSVLLGQAVIFRDFYEFPKLWLPVIFFTLAYEAELSEAGLRRLLQFFSMALVLVFVYAWGQWADLGFSHWLNNFYSAGEHVQRSLDYARRVYSTMGNPNVLGQLLTWSIAAFLLATSLHVGSQLRNIFIIVACLITLAMTGSRYGLLNTGLAFFVVIASAFASGRQRLSRLALPLVLLPLFVAAILVVSNTNQRTLERFQTLRAPADTDSFRQRADDLWLDALNSFSQSPVLGRGPAKTTFETIITDSEFLDVLKKFGLLGFFSYLGYYLFPLFLIWRGMRAARSASPALEDRIPATFLVMRLGFVMILTALAMNVGMTTFYNALLQGFLFLWMGLAARAAKSIGEAIVRYPSSLLVEYR